MPPAINIIAKRSLLYANIIRISTLESRKITLIKVFLICSYVRSIKYRRLQLKVINVKRVPHSELCPENIKLRRKQTVTQLVKKFPTYFWKLSIHYCVQRSNKERWVKHVASMWRGRASTRLLSGNLRETPLRRPKRKSRITLK